MKSLKRKRKVQQQQPRAQPRWETLPVVPLVTVGHYLVGSFGHSVMEDLRNPRYRLRYGCDCLGSRRNPFWALSDVYSLYFEEGRPLTQACEKCAGICGLCNRFCSMKNLKSCRECKKRMCPWCAVARLCLICNEEPKTLEESNILWKRIHVQVVPTIPPVV